MFCVSYGFSLYREQRHFTPLLVYAGKETILNVLYFHLMHVASPSSLRRLSDKAIFVFPSGYIPTDDELRAMTPEVQRTAEFSRKEAKRPRF